MTELSHAISVNLNDFVLHGTFGPFNRKMFRPELLQLLGPQDPDCYIGLAVFGSIAFDLCGELGPVNQIQLLIPHVVHESPANEYFADRWSRPEWLDCWPDHRISWTIGAFHPNATFRSICEQLPELANSNRNGCWAWDGRPEVDVYESKSGVSMFFEKQNDVSDERTLSQLITGYHWGRNTL